VNLNPNLLQGTVSGVFDRAVKGVALGIVVQDQPGALANGIILLGQGQGIA
jgi:hypothetical protein